MRPAVELSGHRKLQPTVTLSMSYRNHGDCVDVLNRWPGHVSPLCVNLADLGDYKAEGSNTFTKRHFCFPLPLPCSDIMPIAHPEGTGGLSVTLLFVWFYPHPPQLGFWHAKRKNELFKLSWLAPNPKLTGSAHLGVTKQQVGRVSCPLPGSSSTVPIRLVFSQTQPNALKENLV